jgi:glycosyltransferase involved in cell wall biosynthesis
MKFSIITPVFNSYHLMERYFDSLEHQTYKDFEVILIDDCSTDGSYKKINQRIQKSNLKIKILQTPQNSGPGYARNMGLDAAEGEWITFVDNDDWVKLNWLESINNVINNINNVDCIIYDYFMVGKNEGEPKVMHSMIHGEEGIIPKSKCMIYVTNHTIGKFYKLSSCNESNIRFPMIRRCEDVAFTCLAIDASRKVYYLKRPFYYYFQRKSSLSNSAILDEQDMLQAFKVLQKKLEDKYPQEIAERSVRDLLYGVVLMMCKAGKNSKAIRGYINSYVSKYPHWYKAPSISCLGWPKKIFLQLVRYKWIPGLRILSWVHSKMIG